MTVLPLNETALQAAAQKVIEVHEGTDDEIADILEDESLDTFATREAISTYLQESGFEVEYGHPQNPKRKCRVVGPWVPVHQDKGED